VEVVTALGVCRFVALGEPVGALVAAELAASYPERVERLVLVDCPFFSDPREPTDELLGPSRERLRPADESGFPVTRTLGFVLEQDPLHAPMRPTQSWMDRANRAQIEVGRDRWQALTALKACALGPALDRVRCPALLLMGEHFYHRAGADEIRRRLPGIHYEVLPDTRFCAGWERAAEIARLAIAFAL
jgi:pimeloyl-ACP methyl ester carboxylesterase